MIELNPDLFVQNIFHYLQYKNALNNDYTRIRPSVHSRVGQEGQDTPQSVILMYPRTKTCL